MKNQFSGASRLNFSAFLRSPELMTIVALSIATGIFVIDIYTPLGIAAAALYSVVVVLAG